MPHPEMSTVLLMILQVVIDTSGWAFMYPLFRLAGVRVASYTHYPTISTDMLLRVTSRQTTFNNNSKIAADPVKSLAKVVYYFIFAAAYGAVGGWANVSFLVKAFGQVVNMHCVT